MSVPSLQRPEREPEVIDIRRRRRQRADIFDEEIHTENITRRTAGGMRSYHKIIIKKDWVNDWSIQGKIKMAFDGIITKKVVDELFLGISHAEETEETE